MPVASPISRLIFAALLGAIVSACASPPPAPATEPEQVVLSAPTDLNIPEPRQDDDCRCDQVGQSSSENYFDRGVRALAARDYARARVYFERHRGDGPEQARREADVGLAFVALLDQSIGEQGTGQGASGVDERAEVMILAMAAIEVLEEQLVALEDLNRALVTDLDKREEALKRLRDLTLGQPEG